ncbi:UNVERIFIED_CONTAM: hypothetical protein PYX00_009770 [Menopon gallinae]|uniref:Lysosomal-trafficking regulator n=1 Tax=Menopon gallinae TaxID=328185 RepID=A0AAW2HCW0_9NEOP
MQKIAQLWDLFVQAEGSSYEKSLWYDVFLSQFIADINDGKTVEEILTFCNWSGAGTLIGCELLSDIDQVCSQPGDGDDLEPLKQHLYSKGWKALAVLLILGQQTFSCSHELANLLISLYPVCLGGKVDGKAEKRGQRNKYLHLNADVIDSCFTKTPSKSKFSSFYRQFLPRGEYLKTQTSSINYRNRKNSRGGKNGRVGCETSSSESETRSDDLDVVIKACALKIKLDPMDFDYFTNVIRSDDDARLDSVLYEPRKERKSFKKISPADFIDESISNIMNSRVSPYELMMLIIKLLISLCRSEPGFSISADNSYPVCSQSVKFALENLCSMQFGSVSLQSLESHETADLKSNLTLLLAISLDRVMGCPDITTNVILTGILPMMLRVLEDSICKLTSDYSDIGTELKEIYERDKQLEVVFGLICSSITFLLSLLLQNTSVNYVRSFLELFKIFIESSCELKKARKEMVSPHLPKRLKQKRYKSGDELHHHHDLFGNTYNPSLMGSTNQQNCCVSSLFMIFVTLLKIRDKLTTDILNKTLKVMNHCGTCCCFTSKNLFQYLTEIIQNHSQKSRILVYRLLENTIYPEMGYYTSQNKTRIACGICFKNDFEDIHDDPRRTSTVEDYLSKRAKDLQSDKVSIQSEKSHQSDSSVLDSLTGGKILLNLDLFHELLLSKDFRIVHGVTSHLLKCAPKMSQKAKRTILFNIFYPTFLTSKAHYMSENDEVSIFRILSSLSVFSSLLGDNSFAEQFINLKGLNHILELIPIPVFSKNCCSVLEKTIVIALLSPEGDSSSFEVLRDAVDDANKLFFKFYGSENELAVDISKVPSAMGVKKRPSGEKTECKNVKKIDVLQQVCTFWKTYANLTLFSPLVRKFFSDKYVLEDCENILQISLKSLTSSSLKSSGKYKVPKNHDYSEGYLFTRLIESLLTFILSTTEKNEKGLSQRETVISQLSDVLLNNDLKNVDVRRLAEVLLKCSLVQPSHNHIVPYTSSPKLPLLTFWSNWEEDCQEIEDIEVKVNSDSSSLEDHYITADEGYEADIEIRDSGASNGEIYETNSSCSASETITLVTSRDFSVDKLDAKNSHTIIHPKLCSLAIDLLIKLYQEKSSDEEQQKKSGSRKSKYSRSKSIPETDKKELLENMRKHRLSCRNINADHSSSDKEVDSDSITRKKEINTKLRVANDVKIKDNDDKCLLGFVAIFQKLASLCRDKMENCVILCKGGIIVKLLNGFRKCLSERKERYSELQRVILDLITILGSYSISKEELTCYLGLFKADNPPVDHLLNPLASIVTNSKSEPAYSLRFPVNVTEVVTCNSSPDIGKSLQIRHKREGVSSCWSSAALSLPLASDMNWSVWMQGFSLSMWLKVDRVVAKNNFQSARAKSPQKFYRKTSKAESHISNCSTLFSDCGMTSDIFNNEDSIRSSPITNGRILQINLQNHMHLFTVGNETLALECWAALYADILVWRLSRVDSHRGYEILAETTSEHCVLPGQWHYLAINVRDFLQRRETVIEVTLIVDGWNEVKLLLSFTGILLRKPRPSSLLLGQQADFMTAKCFLSNIMLFACPVFNRERAVYLLGLGPNCSNLTECQIGKRSPNFTSVFSPRTIGGTISWDKILNDHGGNLKELQDNLLLAYSTENPNIVNTYPLTTSPGSGLLFPGFRPGSSEVRGAQRVPIVITPNIFSHIIEHKYEGLIPSVRLLGGSATFLFLFARVVEISSCPEEQAKSLYLFLKLVQSDCDVFNEFIKNGHYKLLHKVFQSSRCASGLHFIKAMLDACCDKPVVQNNAGNFQVMQHSDAVIVNSFLISTILESWKDWRCSQQENDVLRIFFLTLSTLLRDDHPFREFNVSRLNGVHMVDSLLTFCKERLLYEDKSTLEDNVFYTLVELVRSLMGAPPDFSHIVAIMDCLIILHPVNATYITHTKSSFYLILSAGQTFSVDENAERENSQLNKAMRNRLESFNRNYRMEKIRRNMVQYVDPAKLNKALQNLKQIKQRRVNLNFENNKNNEYNDDLDSNRYSDDLTFDSGIAGSYREHVENMEETDEVIVKATDGSQQNLTSFFPSMSYIEVSNPNTNQTNDEEKYKDQKELGISEDYGAQCIVTEGLLLLLRDTILVLPDNMAYQILNHVVKLEVLLVFANHRDHRVRSAVIKVVSSYLQRCSDEEINKFIKMRGFHHLANQISLFPASLQLVEDCLQLIMRCNVSLDDDIFINQCEITSPGMSCIPPLLALLPRSVHDVSLARSLLNFLLKFYTKDSTSARVLLENGLLETLVKALVASAHVNSDSTDESEKDPVVTEIIYFFTFILNQSLSSPGIQGMQIITDMRLQLYYVYRLEKESCGFMGNCVRIIRDTLCKILGRGLDVIQDKIRGTQSFNKGKSYFLHSVLSNGHQEIEEDNTNRLSVNSKHSSSSNLKNSGGKEISRSELSERFKMFVVNAIEFLIYSETQDGKHYLSQIEFNFLYHLLPMLLQVLSSTLEKRSYSRRTAAYGIYWSVRDVLKTEISEFVVWLLSPRQIVKTRMFLISTLISEAKTKDLLLLLLQTHPQVEQKFSIFLWDLMYNTKLTSSDLRSCQELRESLLQWGAISPQVLGSSNDAWKMDCVMLMNETDKQISSWEKQTEAAIMRCITKQEGLVKCMTADALTMTCAVVEAQNVERKSVMEKMRTSYSENIHITTKWNEIINQLTHERAVWFFEKSYPTFWQLDPTEGPSRVRKRLSRCHIGIDGKYLLPTFRHKLDYENNPEPLAYLFENHQKNCPAMILTERLHCNEKIRTMSLAKVVTPSTEIPGELLIGETCIYFVADDRHKYLNTFGISSTVWPFEDVKEIHDRRYQLQEKAIEIFLANGKTYLIAFQTKKERDDIVAELLECNLPNKLESDNLGHIMQLWREGLMTNWDYLTQLNKMAGRSFNDLMQYPVFPFVLSDYESSVLDLSKKSVYRNFKKPMAVQEKRNEQHYINNYNELLNGLKQVALNKEPYHYGSHYSNSGTVLHFLVRLPPFTKMLLQYQDRNFDLPDRTFHSLHTTWRLASCDSTTDVKEMLPEFFFLPEFLVNSQGFNFGVRQNGEVVDNVELPPWCKNDPRKFIFVHRQALESDYVTENLPYWIDLVFGFKQTGKAAIEAINVFHPATYCGFDVESISDPVERTAWETMVKTYGQTPKQLFKQPHPLAIQSLVDAVNSGVTVVNDVKGLKWGNYVGSPSEPEPSIIWRQQCKDQKMVKLHPLETNDVLVLPQNMTAILRYNKEKVFSGLSLTAAGFRVAIMSLANFDNILRIKTKKELPATPIVCIPSLDPVSICQSSPECDQVWIGHKSGNISVYRFKFRSDRETIEFSDLPVHLQGHSSSVNQIYICRGYSIVVTSGCDGVIIIWDLNSISYIRSIDLKPSHIRTLAVSNTLGDIACISQSSEESCNVLQLYSINATFVESVVIKEMVTSVCFSSAPEGISVNVIACGLVNGCIRLYSSWDLSPVREISNSYVNQSIVCLTYSNDSQLLYASYSDGSVVVWGGSDYKYSGKVPKLISLTNAK